MSLRHYFLAGCCFLMMGASTAQPVPGADPVGLRGDIGGLWHSPGIDGQGLQIDVLDDGQAAITWYSFDQNGTPLWLFGLGEVRDSQIESALSSASGGRFATQSPIAPDYQARGQVRIEFSGCNDAVLEFTGAPGDLPSGSFALQRLTSPQGVACNAEEQFDEQRILSFERSPGEFQALFADLPTQGQDIYDLDSKWEQLPAPLQSRHGIRLTGNNRSDDLAMLIKAPVRGLLPNRSYRLEMDVEIATKVPRGCVGVGGSPGESVYVKLGAVTQEPNTVATGEGVAEMLRLNFDFGIQSESGERALVVGDLSNRLDCDVDPEQWQLKTLSTRGRPFAARTDAEGTLWLVAGTDSGFEGLTHVYYTSLRLRLRSIDE